MSDAAVYYEGGWQGEIARLTARLASAEGEADKYHQKLCAEIDSVKALNIERDTLKAAVELARREFNIMGWTELEEDMKAALTTAAGA